jgi:hypothetical protein
MIIHLPLDISIDLSVAILLISRLICLVHLSFHVFNHASFDSQHFDTHIRLDQYSDTICIFSGPLRHMTKTIVECLEHLQESLRLAAELVALPTAGQCALQITQSL